MDVGSLVDEILRSRKMCRLHQGQPLFGVYQSIYQEVRSHLIRDLTLKRDRGKLHPGTVREKASQLRDSAFRTILEDNQLKRLALEAQRHPPRSELRQYGLRELIVAIQYSGRLCRPHRGKFSPQFYDMIYEDAVNKTLVYVCQKIDTYDPERSQKFMTWVNFRLDKLVLETCHELSNAKVKNLPTIADLENIAQPENPVLPEPIRQCIEADVDGCFKRAHIRNRPDVNFQTIALAILAEKNWKEIAEEFEISMGTASSFFCRSCQKFAPKIAEYLSS